METSGKENDTIKEIKYFLNRFYEEKLTLETKNLLPSEQLLYSNKKILIKKENSNRVINEISKERTLNLFKLSKKGIIYLNVYEYKIESELLKERLEEFKMIEGDGGGKMYLIDGSYREEENRPIYEYKHEGNYYLNDFLDDNFELLQNNLNRGDDFSLICYTSFYTVRGIFDEITNVQEEKNFSRQLNQFIKFIKEEIGDRENYNNIVTFSINLNDYIENKGYFYKIIYELYVNFIINIKDIYIENGYFVFELEKFNNFTNEKINKIFNKKKGFNYKDGDLYINGEKVFFKDKKSKIYNIFKLTFDYFTEFKTNKVELAELERFYLENKNNYETPDNFSINYDYLRRSLEDKNKEIVEKFNLEKSFTGITTLSIQSQYYVPESD